MSNDCLGDFERSCRYVEWAWRLLLGVSRIILCYVNAGKFGLWRLLLGVSRIILCHVNAGKFGVWSCTCAFELTFVFCLIWLGLQVGTWGGVVDGCKHTIIANAQGLLRLGFNLPNNA